MRSLVHGVIKAGIHPRNTCPFISVCQCGAWCFRNHAACVLSAPVSNESREVSVTDSFCGPQPELLLGGPYGTRLPPKLHAHVHAAESFLRAYLGLPLVSGGCLPENCWEGRRGKVKSSVSLTLTDQMFFRLLLQGSSVRSPLPRSSILAEGLNSR